MPCLANPKKKEKSTKKWRLDAAVSIFLPRCVRCLHVQIIKISFKISKRKKNSTSLSSVAHKLNVEMRDQHQRIRKKVKFST